MIEQPTTPTEHKVVLTASEFRVLNHFAFLGLCTVTLEASRSLKHPPSDVQELAAVQELLLRALILKGPDYVQAAHTICQSCMERLDHATGGGGA